MTKAFKVAKREYLAQVRTKGFVIGLLVAPIFMSGSGIAIALLEDKVDTRDRQIAVVDYSGLIDEVVVEAAEAYNETAVYDEETGRKIRPAYLIEIVEPGERDPDELSLELSNRIRRDDLHGFVVVSEGILHQWADGQPDSIAYYAESAALDPVRNWLGNTINNHLRRERAVEAGIDEAAFGDLFDWVNPLALGLVTEDIETGEIAGARRTSELDAILIPVVMLMLLFLMMMMGAMPQLQAVMEEKSMRIAEVIIGSVRPFDFMMGKLIGGVSVSLTAAAFYVLVAVVGMPQLGVGDYIPWHLLPWFFAYVIISIFMYGALLAALGSACNDLAEAQSITFPAMIPMILPMFIAMPITQNPESGFATAVSLFPPFTPLIMMMRQATPGGVPAWQPWVGLVGAILFTIFLIWVGGRIFRVAILLQGTPPKLKNFIRWAFRG
jgi:ABC-type Na+ efflux pump permease subunit